MNKKWFTLVEIVVTITIIVILSAVSFIHYSNYVLSARNSQRVIDLAQLESALELYQKQNKELPIPWAPTFQDNVFIQWRMDNNVPLNSIKEIPLDPKVKIPYTYSKTKKNTDWWNIEEFQLSATIEWEKWDYAIVKGSYNPISIDRYPSIIMVWNTYDVNKFVLNEQENNLSYSLRWDFAAKSKEWTSIESILNEQWAKPNWLKVRHPYESCDEIKSAGKFIWEWVYKIYVKSSNSFSDTTCWI